MAKGIDKTKMKDMIGAMSGQAKPLPPSTKGAIAIPKAKGKKACK